MIRLLLTSDVSTTSRSLSFLFRGKYKSVGINNSFAIVNPSAHVSPLKTKPRNAHCVADKGVRTREDQKTMKLFGKVSSAFVIVVIASLTQSCSSLRFYLNDRERRCFNFEAQHGVRVLGHRSISNGRGQAELSLEIKATNGRVVYESHSGDAKEAMFSFITPAFDASHDYEEYEYEMEDPHAVFTACLTLSLHASMHTPNEKRAVTFWVEVDARGSGESAQGHATGSSMIRVQHALRQMQNMLKKVAIDLTQLQARERRLVKRSEATAGRLKLFAGVSLTVLIATSSLQYMHYKKLFKAKKLC